MLAGQLRDAAVATAKSYGHELVEPRHILFGAARLFRSRPEIEALLPQVKAALEPRGTGLGVPSLSPEAEELVTRLAASRDPVVTLLELLGSGPPAGAGSAGGSSETATAETTAPPTPVQTAPPETPETVAQVLAEVEQLIGLASVKRQLVTIAAVVQANQERVRAGLTPVTSGLHLVFTGPPGTGKTTVARLVARLYAAAGALPGSNFTEVSRADLIAGYVGQTAIKTSEVIARTRPGVLFIDEAYALTPSHPSDFGAEAIATLVKAMEDYRSELAVIAAGYGEEMTDFVGSNPGLKSRFKTYIAFPDYAADELTRIFESFAANAGIGLETGVLKVAEEHFRRAATTRDFGNARFARSLFEQAYGRMAARAAADGTVTIDEVSKLVPADLEWEAGGLERPERRIGFLRE